MAVESIAVLKTYFETNDVPTEAQFVNWFDSIVHTDKAIRMVDAVADLVNETLINDKTLVGTRGYYTANDGAGALYQYSSSSSATCDGGFVLDGLGSDNSPAATAATYAGTGTGRFLAVDKRKADVRRFGAKADGVTDDTFRVSAAYASGAPVQLSGDGNTLAIDQMSITNVAVSTAYNGDMSLLDVQNVDESAFQFNDNGTNKIKDLWVDGMRIAQPTSSVSGGGTANNHAAVKLLGADNCIVSNIMGDDVMCAVSVSYGSVGLSDRSSEGCVVSNVVASDIEKLGVEIIGGAYCAVNNVVVTANEGESHAFRLTGFDFAPSCYNAASNIVAKDMLTAVSLQNTSKHNFVTSVTAFSADNMFQCTNPVKLADSVSYNFVSATGSDHKYVCYNDGASYNRFEFIGHTITPDADGYVITEVNAPTFDGRGFNVYRGTIHEIVSPNPGVDDVNGATFRYPGNRLDLMFSNESAGDLAQAVNIAAGADYTTGEITVNYAKNGISVYADHCNLRLVARNISFTEILIAGHDNVIQAVTDGIILVQGDRNVITGSCDRLEFQAGADNNKSVVIANVTVDNGTGNTKL